MISIADIKVSKTYREGKYWKPHYEAKLAIRLPDTYSDQWITLSEENTTKVVDLIVELASQDLRFVHYVPSEPKDDPAPVAEQYPCKNAPIPADEMEPL